MTRLHLSRRLAARAGSALDLRYGLAKTAREQSSHVFPKHFSFFWGEIALYSFAVLLLSGTVMALHFVPDTTDTTYHGSFGLADGLHMSRAYQSVLTLSFDVTGGLLIRQMHHWAALLFVAAIVVHMLRNFFTGAFRRPRELTWITGVVLLMLGVLEGYSGYSMVDDLLSGMGVRIISGLLLSVPVVGTWLQWMVFGGEYDGDIWISRFFVGHVFLLPGLLVALVAFHLGLVWYQKHTHFPGPGARNDNVVGERAAPGFLMKTVANGIVVAGVIGVMGGVLQINPVFLWGPYSPANGSTGAQPDWYAMFMIGGLRLMPGWPLRLGVYTVPPPFWPGLVLPIVMFLLLAAYPFLERRILRDTEMHQLLQRPRDNAVRTAIGTMAVTFWALLTLAGSDDVVAIAFDIPLGPLRWAERISVIVLPGIAYVVAYRICLGLQRRDRDNLRHGLRTGLLTETADGVFAELRQPPGGVDHDGRPVPLRYDGVRIDERIGSPTEEAEP